MKKSAKNIKKTEKTAKNTRQKKNKVLTGVISIVAILIAIAIGTIIGYNNYMYGRLSEINEEINFEERLFENAKANYDNPKVILDSSISLQKVFIDLNHEDGSSFYHFQFNGSFDEQGFPTEELYGKDGKYDTIYDDTIITEFSDRDELLIQSARNFVVEYIKDSNVLTDKEMLIQEVENLPFYLYTDSTHPELDELDAPAIYIGEAVFCNRKYQDFFCEFMFVHEMIHHVRLVTSGGKFSQERYYASKLDETITDLITYAMSPKMFTSNGFVSGYSQYYEPVNKYLTIFGEDALEAFFYGYEDFLESKYKTFSVEHDAFATALYHYMNGDGAMASCEVLINKWDSAW